VLLALGWGAPYGLVAGLVIGLLADWVRRRTRARKTAAGDASRPRI